jgi:hypothetical protein
VVLTSTLGGYLGALLLCGLGAALGLLRPAGPGRPQPHLAAGRRPPDAAAQLQPFTLAGSGVWNGTLISIGAALGSQYALVERYSRFLNYAVYATLAVLVGWLVLRALRRRRPTAPPSPSS